MTTTSGQLTPNLLDPSEIETYRAYYQLQYQRIAQHESGRLQVSNFVVAASVVALGILALPIGNVCLAAYGVPLSVVAVNSFAIIYATRSRHWVKLHQARAAKVLERLSPSLKELQTQADQAVKRVNSDKSPLRSQLVQAYIHGTLAAMGVLIALQWALG